MHTIDFKADSDIDEAAKALVAKAQQDGRAEGTLHGIQLSAHQNTTVEQVTNGYMDTMTSRLQSMDAVDMSGVDFLGESD